MLLRKRLALWICPELRADMLAIGTVAPSFEGKVDAAELITLAETLATHGGVTHYAISMRALGKGDFFKNLKDGRDCRTSTAAKLVQWFSDNWPADLEWPRAIARPTKTKKEAA